MKLSKTTKAYKNKLAYTKEFTKANYKQIKLMLHNINDADIIEWLNKQESKNGYIKQLIRNDMGSR